MGRAAREPAIAGAPGRLETRGGRLSAATAAGADMAAEAGPAAVVRTKSRRSMLMLSSSLAGGVGFTTHDFRVACERRDRYHERARGCRRFPQNLDGPVSFEATAELQGET